jgi:hypothetical protein
VPLGAYRDAKFRALGAYRTQLTVDDRDIVLSGGQRHTVADVEVFRPFRPLATSAGTTTDQATARERFCPVGVAATPLIR